MKKILLFLYLLSMMLPSYAVVTAEYRMDECYWLDNASGVINDVKETNNSLDGTSHGVAQTYIPTLLKTSKVCMGADFNLTGDFVDVANHPLLTTTNTFSISLWVKQNTPLATGIQIIVSKTTNYGDGFTLYTYWSGALQYLIFDIGNGTFYQIAYTSAFATNIWQHIVATYDGATMRLYLNGIQAAATPYTLGILNANVPMLIGEGIGGTYQYKGSIDELKVYNHTLTPLEITTIYNNELAGKNYDGSIRTCPICDANATAGIWQLVGIPADLRATPLKDVANVFDEFNATSYNNPAAADGWIVFKRDYNTSDNASWYTPLSYTGTPMQFGQGYFLLSKISKNWSENNLTGVDYNSTNVACVRKPCVEINLTSVSLNFGPPANDPNNGSGKNRNNMLGFIGHKPVNWADCRILVNGVAYTPSAAAAAGYADNQVWQYNPGAPGADANGYTTCNDISPGGCKLEPYKGFWVILHGITKNKTVQLLIPKE